MSRRHAVTVRERLQLLARHLEAFEAPDFSFGEWERPVTDAEGVISLGWYRFSPGAEAFLADVRGGGWIEVFGWQAWLATPEGHALANDRAALAAASADDLRRLLTAIVRSDRFTEGSVAGAYESGLLTAIVRRAKELSEAASA
jgi:hypothetical protein